MATKPKKAAVTMPLRGVVDDGTREIPIVNKFGKLICNVYIRPADFSIIDRYNDFIKDFDDVVKPLSGLNIERDGTATLEKDWAVLKQVEQEVKDRFNALFDMDEADEIFAKRNAFSSVGGEFFCAKVLAALGDVITQAINEEAALSEARVSKYMAPLKQEGAANAGNSSDNP